MTNATRRPPALTIQVDVDTLRNLFVFYGLGDPGRPAEDPIYRLALPRFADLFEAVGVRATFFVIGHDLADPANREVVRRLHAAGHEIANHTQTHDYDFGRRARARKRDEIARAGEAIAEAMATTWTATCWRFCSSSATGTTRRCCPRS
jgi:peptidoglycan/xylan/chitin deacetylase (PgdA/CDA1 family)